MNAWLCWPHFIWPAFWRSVLALGAPRRPHSARGCSPQDASRAGADSPIVLYSVNKCCILFVGNHARRCSRRRRRSGSARAAGSLAACRFPACPAAAAATATPPPATAWPTMVGVFWHARVHDLCRPAVMCARRAPTGTALELPRPARSRVCDVRHCPPLPPSSTFPPTPRSAAGQGRARGGAALSDGGGCGRRRGRRAWPGGPHRG
jgi:hypothetical protein